MRKPERYFFEQREGRSYTLTVVNKNVGLHLVWKGKLGQALDFQGVQITEVNLEILKEVELLRNISTLSPDISPGECEQLLARWGYVKRK